MRNTIGVILDSMTSLVPIITLVIWSTIDVPVEEGDAYVRGALFFFFFGAPILIGCFLTYYTIIYFMVRSAIRRHIRLLIFAIITSALVSIVLGLFMIQDGMPKAALATLGIMLIGSFALLLGSSVMYYVCGWNRPDRT